MLKGNLTDPLTRENGIGYVRNVGAALFNNMSVQLNGQQIENINQVGLQDTMTQLSFSNESWLNSGGTGFGWTYYLSNPLTDMETKSLQVDLPPTGDWSLGTVGPDTGVITIISGAGSFTFNPDMVGGTMYFTGAVGTGMTGLSAKIKKYISASQVQLDGISGVSGPSTTPQLFNVVYSPLIEDVFPENELQDRIGAVTDGKIVELFYRPPLGMMQVDTAIKGGFMQFLLNWNPNLYKDMADALMDSVVGVDYGIKLLSFDFWQAQVCPDPSVPQDGLVQTFDIDTAQTLIQALTSTSSQLTFNIAPSSYKILAAFRNNNRDQGAAAALSYTQFDHADIRTLQMAVPSLGVSVPPLQYQLNLTDEDGVVDRAYEDFMKYNFGATWDQDSTSMSIYDWIRWYPMYAFPLVKKNDQLVNQVNFISTHADVPSETSLVVVCLSKLAVQVTYTDPGCSSAITRVDIL